MLCLTLTAMGHTVEEARDGEQGIAQYEREPADVVLTDLIMPEKEGIETIMELKRKHPNVKIIAMSGGGRVTAADYLQLAKKLGAIRTLAKPFTNEALRATIAATLASA